MVEGKPAEHPYNMYCHIMDQAEAVRRVVTEDRAHIDQVAGAISGRERVFLVGIGTSFHAAQVIEFGLRAFGGGIQAYAVHSFDFALYGPELNDRDCVIVISHKGTKAYSVKALEQVRQAGALTVLVTGIGLDGKPEHFDHVIETVPLEQSATYTISYSGALSAMLLLAERIGHHRTNHSAVEQIFFEQELPAVIEAGTQLESTMQDWANTAVNARRIWLTGGGPSAVTAQEIALKIKEASYLQAEGLQVEQFLHGALQNTEPEDVFIVIAPSGPAQSRVFQFVEAVREIGAPCFIVSDGTAASITGIAASVIDVPQVPEPFTAISCLVPLQLFAYHLALAAGTHPDTFRLDDPRFERAFQKASLYEPPE
jgi:glutamine---fructose-6-phosphate transaminase (isomerizing)